VRKKLAILVIVGLVVVGGVKAEECDNPGGLSDSGVISGCISKYEGILTAISSANTTNRGELKRLNDQITNLKAQINLLEKQLEKLAKNIFDREVKLGVKQELLAAKVKQDYIRKRDQPLLLVLFSSQSANQFYRDVAYREMLAANDRGIIAGVAGEIHELNVQSSRLNVQKQNLAGLKKRVDSQAGFLAKEVEKADKYVADLSGKISALSARQQQLLAAKTGTYATTVGDVPLADDPAARPDYNPGFSPAFAGFSFGAPHFRGMSQYGAFGRAKSGQNYEAILRAYYGDVRIADVNTSLTIKTSVGAMDFENRYLRGIAEMPSQWASEGGMEALAAQAIAARSYALAYTGWRMGNQNTKTTICVTEACQVWKSSKADNPGAWATAVSETRGKILVGNGSGEVVNAWYASTSGGYQDGYSSLGHTTPGFWDTTSDWTTWASGAWEVKGGSPWFYKGWYKSRSGKTCGRSHPWLKDDEFSDLVNAAIVVANGGDVSGIFPEDVRSCLGENDNPWSKDRMASEADKYGGRVTNITNISVKHSSGGYTDKIVLQTNRGEVVIAGANFKKAFNLRAPGMLALMSGLFNVEKK